MTISNVVYIKDPDAVLDYTSSWASWLDTGETISTSTFTVATGITIDSQSNGTTSGTVWLSGGTAGTNYSIRHRITTSAGRTDDRTFIVAAKHR